MKKLLAFAALFAVVALTSCKYDDDDLWNSVHGLENRVAKLEELCKQMNTNISSLQTIVTALQNNVYVTGTTPLMKDGKEIGYTITFSKGNPITIYHGKDGQGGSDGKDGVDGTDGKDGTTPTIGVKQDSDGIYYWTLNGEWLTNAQGNKIKAEGTNGKDGADGSDGSDGNDGIDGTNGKDGITPKLEIREEYWWISYDNGTNWTQLGKATGEDGKDGLNGDSVFKGVTQDDKNVYFELADGTIITIAKFSSTEEDVNNSQIIQFEDAKVKAICVQNWDTNKDGELSHGEAAKVASIRKFFRGTTIQSFDEFQYFTGIDEIGVDAFKQCYDLINITIPNNVLWIEECAFAECSNLRVVNIPNRVTWIGQDAFRLSGLTNIELGNSVSIIGDGAFYNCCNLLSVTMPDNVTHIGSQIFQECNNLQEIKLSNNLSVIRGNMFFSCKSLHSIIIPDNVISIENNAFYNCKNLTDVTIGNNVKSIRHDMFTGCGNLQTIYCKPITPPTFALPEYAFGNDMSSALKIYVPIASVETYKTADGWQKYANQIVGYNFTE